MGKISAICGMELQRLLKKKQNYVIMFVLPLIFTFIFGGLAGGNASGKARIPVIDEDQTELSSFYIKQMKEENSLFTLYKSTKQEADSLLESKKIPGAILISKGFQESILEKKEPEILFYKIPEFTSSSPITGVIENKLHKLQLMVTASAKWSEYSAEDWQVMFDKLQSNTVSAPLEVKTINIEEKKATTDVEGITSRTAGFSIMFVMVMIMSATGTILEVRSNGVWSRLLTSPISRFEITMGYLLFFFLIGWIQFSVLIGATHYLFGVQWGDPFAVVLLVSALILAVIGIGLMIAGFVKTVEQQAAIGNMIVVATCMVSGVYWPLEIEPEFMQKIAQFLPQTWAIKGFTDLLASGGGMVDILDNVGILLAFAFLFLVIGMRRIRFE